MKRLRILGVLLIGLFLPVLVHAAGSISVTGPNNAVVGSTITIGVKLSTGDAWQVLLDYDKSLLQLTGSTAEDGGGRMANTSVGNTSRSYTFKFKALKSGNAKVGISSYDVQVGLRSAEESSIAMNAGTKTIKIQTQAEIEASYSDDATLRSLSVEGYDITPEFDKQTYEYNLEVENDIEKVNVVANKNNANARVEGAGEIELKEGNNKVEVVVTAQKGNSLTYTININRKELNPISVIVDNKNYTIVRKAEDLPKYSGFVETTVNYNGEEIPALVSEAINKTIVGVRDDDGNITTYVYNNEKLEGKYIELKSNQLAIYIIEKDSVPYKGFNKENISISNEDIVAFKYKSLNNYYLIYGMDLSTGKEGYYLYDKNNNTFQLFDEELFNSIINENKLYLYLLIGSFTLTLICIIIVIILLSKKGKRKKEDKDDVKKIDTIFDEVENKKEKKNKKDKDNLEN